MRYQPKPLQNQVLLITGASSGIGLSTARRAASRGARVILVSRNREALEKIVRDIIESGGEAVHAVADVADEAQLRQAAETGISRFGRIDTWINNAGVGMFGRITQIKTDDDRRLFETNFWGVVNGSRLGVQFLRNGGTLINVGSVVSDRAVPLQGMYSASKHAVQGFTDALRMEIEEEGLPINITLIKPSAIDTPFARHGMNYLDVEPTLPPPVYAPHLVADTILHAAEHPAREYFVGGGGRVLASLGKQLPRIMDLVMEKIMFRQQRSDRPAGPRDDNALHSPAADGQERGGLDREHYVLQHSAYNVLAQRPWLAVLGVVALGAVAYTLIRQQKPRQSEMQRISHRLKDLWTDLREGGHRNGNGRH
jgi:NAD(P)-dependent dehydrogenase (short-subunit alcohol dehydrogenase family)